MGMTVLAYNRSDKSKQMQEDGVIPVTLEEAFINGDLVSLHLAASPDTRHIVDARVLSLMKKAVISSIQAGGVFWMKRPLPGL